MAIIVTKQEVGKVAPLYRDAIPYNAFLALLSHEEARLYKKMLGTPSAEDLIRTSAQLTLLDNLKRTRERYLDIEKGLSV